jgi:Ring finger domain
MWGCTESSFSMFPVPVSLLLLGLLSTFALEIRPQASLQIDCCFAIHVCQFDYSSQEGWKSLNMECGICLEDNMVQPVVLPDCRHAFCFACLYDYQNSTQNPSCPFCRQDMADGMVRAGQVHLHHIMFLLTRAVRLEPGSVERARLYRRAGQQVDQILAVTPDNFKALNAQAPVQAIARFTALLEQDKKQHPSIPDDCCSLWSLHLAMAQAYEDCAAMAASAQSLLAIVGMGAE